MSALDHSLSVFKERESIPLIQPTVVTQTIYLQPELS